MTWLFPQTCNSGKNLGTVTPWCHFLIGEHVHRRPPWCLQSSSGPFTPVLRPGTTLTLFALLSLGGAQLWPMGQLQKLEVQRTNRHSVILQWALDTSSCLVPGCLLGHGFVIRAAGPGGDRCGRWGEWKRRQSLFFLLSLQATRVCFQWKSRSCLLSSLPKGKGRTLRGRRLLNSKD